MRLPMPVSDPVRCRRSVTLLPTVTRRVFVTCPFVRKRVTDGENVTVRLESASPDRTWPAWIVQHPVFSELLCRRRTKPSHLHKRSEKNKSLATTPAHLAVP